MLTGMLDRRRFLQGAGMLVAPCMLPPAAVRAAEGPLPAENPSKGKSNPFKHLIIRADEFCWERDERGKFPLVDLAAQAGATGLHAWGNLPIEVMDAYLASCRERNLTTHQGIGVCAYGVCDGEDPTDPATRRKLKDHVARVLESYDYDGVEFQTGEYDTAHTAGASGDDAWARRLVDALNPIIEYTLTLKDSLWIRTELLMTHFTDADIAEVSRSLHPRCTVEWSYRTGPFDGAGAFQKGRALLAKDKRFSWFLKTLYYLTHFWYQEIVGVEKAKEFAPRDRATLRRLKEIPVPTMTAQGMCLWANHWREWAKTLHEARRKTLTICHCPAGMPMPDGMQRLLLAAVALARDPDVPNDQVLSLLDLAKNQ